MYEQLKRDGMDERWRDFETKAWVPFAARYAGCYPAGPAPKPGLGVVNAMKEVAVRGGALDIYFDGSRAGSFTDSSYSGGDYGCMTFVARRRTRIPPRSRSLSGAGSSRRDRRKRY